MAETKKRWKNLAIITGAIIIIAIIAFIILQIPLPDGNNGINGAVFFEKDYIIAYSSLVAEKNVKITRDKHIEEIKLKGEGRDNFAIITIIPKELASNASSIEFSVQGNKEVLDNDPLIKTIAIEGKPISLKMTFAPKEERISTINVILPLSFLDALDESQLIQLNSELKKAGELNLDVDKANEYENSLGQKLVETFSSAAIETQTENENVISFQVKAGSSIFNQILETFEAQREEYVPQQDSGETKKKRELPNLDSLVETVFEDFEKTGEEFTGGIEEPPPAIQETPPIESEFALPCPSQEDIREEMFFPISILAPKHTIERKVCASNPSGFGTSLTPEPGIERINEKYFDIKIEGSQDPYTVKITLDLSNYLKENAKFPDDAYGGGLRLNYGIQDGGPYTIPFNIKIDDQIFPGDFIFAAPDIIHFKSINGSSLEKPVFVVNSLPFSLPLKGCKDTKLLQRTATAVMVSNTDSCTLTAGRRALFFDKRTTSINTGDKILEELYSADSIVPTVYAPDNVDWKTCSRNFCACPALAGSLQDLERKYNEYRRSAYEVRDSYYDSYGTYDFAFGTIVMTADFGKECELPLRFQEIDIGPGRIYFISIETNLITGEEEAKIKKIIAGGSPKLDALSGQWPYVSDEGMENDTKENTIYTFAQRFTPDSACFIGPLADKVREALYPETSEELTIFGKITQKAVCNGQMHPMQFSFATEEDVEKVCEGKRKLYGDYVFYAPIKDWTHTAWYTGLTGTGGGCIEKSSTSHKVTTGKTEYCLDEDGTAKTLAEPLTKIFFDEEPQQCSETEEAKETITELNNTIDPWNKLQEQLVVWAFEKIMPAELETTEELEEEIGVDGKIQQFFADTTTFLEVSGDFSLGTRLELREKALEEGNELLDEISENEILTEKYREQLEEVLSGIEKAEGIIDPIIMETINSLGDDLVLRYNEKIGSYFIMPKNIEINFDENFVVVGYKFDDTSMIVNAVTKSEAEKLTESDGKLIILGTAVFYTDAVLAAGIFGVKMRLDKLQNLTPDIVIRSYLDKYPNSQVVKDPYGKYTVFLPQALTDEEKVMRISERMGTEYSMYYVGSEYGDVMVVERGIIPDESKGIFFSADDLDYSEIQRKRDRLASWVRNLQSQPYDDVSGLEIFGIEAWLRNNKISPDDVYFGDTLLSELIRRGDSAAISRFMWEAEVVASKYSVGKMDNFTKRAAQQIIASNKQLLKQQGKVGKLERFKQNIVGLLRSKISVEDRIKTFVGGAHTHPFGVGENIVVVKHGGTEIYYEFGVSTFDKGDILTDQRANELGIIKEKVAFRQESFDMSKQYTQKLLGNNKEVVIMEMETNLMDKIALHKERARVFPDDEINKKLLNMLQGEMSSTVDEIKALVRSDADVEEIVKIYRRLTDLHELGFRDLEIGGQIYSLQTIGDDLSRLRRLEEAFSNEDEFLKALRNGSVNPSKADIDNLRISIPSVQKAEIGIATKNERVIGGIVTTTGGRATYAIDSSSPETTEIFTKAKHYQGEVVYDGYKGERRSAQEVIEIIKKIKTYELPTVTFEKELLNQSGALVGGKTSGGKYLLSSGLGDEAVEITNPATIARVEEFLESGSRLDIDDLAGLLSAETIKINTAVDDVSAISLNNERYATRVAESPDEVIRILKGSKPKKLSKLRSTLTKAKGWYSAMKEYSVNKIATRNAIKLFSRAKNAFMMSKIGEKVLKYGDDVATKFPRLAKTVSVVGKPVIKVGGKAGAVLTVVLITLEGVYSIGYNLYNKNRIEAYGQELNEKVAGNVSLEATFGEAAEMLITPGLYPVNEPVLERDKSVTFFQAGMKDTERHLLSMLEHFNSNNAEGAVTSSNIKREQGEEIKLDQSLENLSFTGEKINAAYKLCSEGADIDSCYKPYYQPKDKVSKYLPDETGGVSLNIETAKKLYKEHTGQLSPLRIEYKGISGIGGGISESFAKFAIFTNYAQLDCGGILSKTLNVVGSSGQASCEEEGNEITIKTLTQNSDSKKSTFMLISDLIPEEHSGLAVTYPQSFAEAVEEGHKVSNNYYEAPQDGTNYIVWMNVPDTKAALTILQEENNANCEVDNSCSHLKAYHSLPSLFDVVDSNLLSEKIVSYVHGDGTREEIEEQLNQINEEIREHNDSIPIVQPMVDGKPLFIKLPELDFEGETVKISKTTYVEDEATAEENQKYHIVAIEEEQDYWVKWDCYPEDPESTAGKAMNWAICIDGHLKNNMGIFTN
ncbi:MAG: hypothetical protein ABID38_05370 [Candidatus Diapherotrites archaeon]